ncbi:Lrp/AsnC family transcriptional regulator [Streptomyces sp. NPDC001312]|uniref:Lrp/AsnC family transcriptional regulator n=1 Tax=Streptomyces sp. NPDC001312 TaxID=3364561 RepID=UPI0036B4FDC5
MSRRDAALSRVSEVVPAARPAVPLDETDLSLLRLLAADARTSQRQLAVKLGISPPTVGERMNRLERLGVIRGYSVQVDWEALGFGVPVYLSVKAARGYDVAEMMRSLWEITEVDDVTLVTGSLDLVVRLRVRDDTHLRSVLLNRIWQIAGMQGTETMLGVAEMPPKAMLTNLISQMQADSVKSSDAETGTETAG